MNLGLDKICIREFNGIDNDNPFIYLGEVDFEGIDRRHYSLRRIVSTGKFELYSSVYSNHLVDVEINGIVQLVIDSKEVVNIIATESTITGIIPFMNTIVKSMPFSLCYCKVCRIHRANK